MSLKIMIEIAKKDMRCNGNSRTDIPWSLETRTHYRYMCNYDDHCLYKKREIGQDFCAFNEDSLKLNYDLEQCVKKYKQIEKIKEMFFDKDTRGVK